jgi:L-alanine-DL-glutamate epimerase-like enolase superfamily enzyme
MPDVMRIGGVSGWLRAAALAEPRGILLSSHLFPEISAHLLAVTPTCHWLEYIDWASPISGEMSRNRTAQDNQSRMGSRRIWPSTITLRGSRS